MKTAKINTRIFSINQSVLSIQLKYNATQVKINAISKIFKSLLFAKAIGGKLAVENFALLLLVIFYQIRNEHTDELTII